MTWVLDTQTWIWLVEAPERLPPRVRSIMAEPGNCPLGLSAISPWEVAKKVSLGRMALSVPLRQWLALALPTAFISLLPVSPEVAIDACSLPGAFHRDPADQIITATARVHGAGLITADQRLLGYPHLRAVWD